PGFMLLYTETNGLYEVLLNAMGGKESKGTTKMAYTDYIELQYSDMKKMLDHFDSLTRPVFEKDTLEYATIWGSTRERFYNGSYEMREIALKGLADSMNIYPALEDAATEVMAYHDKLKQARETQQGLISGFKTDSKGVLDAVEALILQQDRNLGWLKFYYAKLPDPEKSVNAFFDLSKITSHSKEKIYPKQVPVGAYIKLCKHTYKITDRVRIEVDGEGDALFGLTSSVKNECNNMFKVFSGTIIEKPVLEVFPSLTYSITMVKNASSLKSTHVIFTILEA
ncbi:MAG: hypothetical protein WCH34_03970, partial [Bacteroidota bacterium]